MSVDIFRRHGCPRCWGHLVLIGALLLMGLLPVSAGSAEDDSDLVFDDFDNSVDKDALGVNPVSSPLLQDDKSRHMDKEKLHHNHTTTKVEDVFRFQDDEDYIDQADGSGSGDGSDERTTTTIEPVTTTTPTPPANRPVYYRMTLNMTSVDYNPNLAYRDSVEFQKLSSEITQAIEPFYESVDGQQIITVLKFEPHAPGVLTTMDLGTLNYYDEENLKSILLDHVKRGSVGSFSVHPQGFSFREIGKLPSIPVPKPCAQDQFTCDNGECIQGSERCNGRQECADWSDEAYCPTPPATGCRGDDQKQCSDGSCIDNVRICDGVRDCSQGEDERDCEPIRCGDDQFLCDETRCIPKSRRCDRNRDCSDQSDEQNCPTCSQSEWPCESGHCLDLSARCNGRVECPRDDSDERDCPAPQCRESEFDCGDGTCVDQRARCNGRQDCRDYSDERNCACRPDQFTCQDGSCISAGLKCNGYRDCRDNSDEADCVDVTCSPAEFRCSDGTCIDISFRCNRRYDCSDLSDEDDCIATTTTEPPPTCSLDEFSCGDGVCVRRDRLCDRNADCQDGSDERNCACSAGQFRCSDGICIDERYKCDGRSDCRDGSDEIDCIVECRSGQFRCGDGSCIDNRFLCDGRLDCVDGLDESLANCATPVPPTCRSNEFRCYDGSCVDSRKRCDRNHDCRDGSDERDCQCLPYQFRCQNGQCIDANRHCDNTPDCSDRSDEQDCSTGHHCKKGQFKCSSGECIATYLRCDGKWDCSDNSDEGETECYWRPCLSGQFRCENGPCISNHLRCDGRNDCQDTSDELDCPLIGNIRLVTYPEREEIEQGREAVLQCRDEGSQRAAVKWSREGGQPLPPGSTDITGRLTIPTVQLNYTGVYSCSAVGVVPPQPSAVKVSYLVVKSYEIATERPPGTCRDEEVKCRTGECISRSYVCDGDLDCGDGSDEFRCNEAHTGVCDANQFQCTNRNCILKIWKCDGENDCSDNSDEDECDITLPGETCRIDEFQCTSVDQCILRSQHCDGHLDCHDSSDEIGCGPPTVVQPPPNILKANVGETVVIICVAIGTPTPEISWRLNWGPVPPPPRVTSTSINGRGVLTITNVQESDQGAYSCEVINSKDSILVRPDCNLQVMTPEGVCNPPYFNAIAQTSSDCLRCFCFGATNQCQSSRLFITTLPHGNEISVVPVTIGSLTTDDLLYPVNQDLIVHLVDRDHEFKIDDRIAQNIPRSLLLYWSLPRQFLGDKLGSYGSDLAYQVYFKEQSTSSYLPDRTPDVIIKGNGITLYHFYNFRLAPGIRNSLTVRFWEGEWYKLDNELASREDLMMVLQNLSAVLLRASYVVPFAESSLINVRLSIAIDETTTAGRAAFVELCSCPPGYEGTSCERCASGYSRVNTGRYLGECRRTSCYCHEHSDNCDPQGNCYNCQHNTEGSRCDRCKPGFYGDARLGSPNDCLPCPCPLTTPSNQFSPTCYLDVDSRPKCNACRPGYQGTNCEHCAPGYAGEPSQPGGSCIPVSTQCDSVGSLTATPNPLTGVCQCKELTTGQRCDRCRSNAYHLNPHTLTGCISCFCMGITEDCTSSYLFRSVEISSFAYDRQGFVLGSLELSIPDISSGLEVSTSSRELSYRLSTRPRSPVYYWKLPDKFLGNKVTSYGGFLRYTVRYATSGSSSSETMRSPDVQITGNNIILQYQHTEAIRPFTTQTVSVPLFERYWKRIDGEPTNREHLLMALAGLERIFIKATYTTDTQETALREVSLDITTPRDIQRGSAPEVEQCRCPPGYVGTSCEACDVGYTRGGSGDYLGICETCFCNGHSSDCDALTGVCRSCQHNTVGDFCAECTPGYKGTPSNGTPNDCQRTDEPDACQCHPYGSIGPCDSSRQCACKAHAQGRNCEYCKDGYYNLANANDAGCSKCFCFNVANQCSSSSLFWSQIVADHLDTSVSGFSITTRYQDRAFEGITTVPARNELHFNNFASSQSATTLYWSLPSIFTGNRLKSYGGKLQFSLRYLARVGSSAYNDADVVINGNGKSVFFVDPLRPPENTHTVNTVVLEEKNWQQIDSQGLAPATRETFMTVLANVQGILIRATYGNQMIEVSLGDVKLESAVPQNTGAEIASSVEQCQCPPGYAGTSCEDCAPGYIRDRSSGNNLGQCLRCNCHSHSDTCDPNTGQCLRCQHNTQGSSCEHCSSGFFGDATRGSPDDCEPCPCPLTVPTNQFARSCYLDTDGYPTCAGCSPGYTGRNCEQCAPGYQGNPRVPGDSCQAGGRPLVSVRIVEPKVVSTPDGSTVTFQCYGTSNHGRQIEVTWSKDGGRLPSQAQSVSGVLTIREVQVEDSGTYVCSGVDVYRDIKDYANLEVIGGYYNAPQARIEPRSLEVAAGDYVEFTCIASGHPSPALTWSGGLYDRINPFSTFTDGVFRIPSVRKEDEANYYCTATNIAGTDTARAMLIVRDAGPPSPDGITVEVTPEALNARPGDSVSFNCRASGNPTPTVTWSKASGQLPVGAVQSDGQLYLRRVDDSYRGVYICTASNGVATPSYARATLDITSAGVRPSVRIEPDRQTVPQGTTGELRCIVTGDPTPTIKWGKIGEELGQNHQESGNSLRILNARIEDRGVYTCLAENSEGRDQASAIVEVERREPPAVELYPGTSQTIGRGESALFQCRETAGAPPPTLLWSRVDGRPLPTTAEIINDAVIRFNRVTGDEQGQYMCTATNAVGSVTAIANLNIQGTPTITITPSNPLTVATGQHVRLECQGHGIPPPNVVWRAHPGLTDERRPLDSSRVSVAVKEIFNARREDSGYYVCVASNSAGTTEERVQLIVTDSNVPTPGINVEQREFVVDLGTEAVLRCSVVGASQSLELSWIRGDRSPMPVQHNIRDGVLTIYNVRKEDAGDYTCLGIIDGTANFAISTRLVVQAPPRISLSPSTQTAKTGDSVVFRCTVTGDEPITVEWSKVAGSFSPNVYVRGGDLEFRGISAADAGRYLCQARNAIGRAEGMAEVHVNEYGCTSGSPCTDGGCVGTDCLPVGTGCTDTTTVGQDPCGNEASNVEKELIVYVGARVDLHCKAFGNDQQVDVQWHKESGSLPSNSQVYGSILRINRARIEDSGRYICTGADSQGTRTWFGVLRVQVACSQDQFKCLDGTCIAHNLNCNGKYDCADGSDELICVDKIPCQGPYYFHCDSGQCIHRRKVCDHNFDCTDRSDEIACGYRFSRGLSALSVRIEPTLDHIRRGDSLDVRCVVTGDPAAVVMWSKVGSPLPYNVQTSGDILRISDVQPENGGLYRCTVSTFTGSFKEDYVLSIRDLESLPQNTEVETHTAPMGTNVTLKCRSDVGNHATYMWTKQGGILPLDASIHEDVLTIPEVMAEDAGTFVCSASNAQQTVDTQVILTVTGVVPYFAQAPLSYITLPTLPDAYLKFYIELSFKPEVADGLILYNGQQTGGGGDFVSFGLSQGHAEFRFDVGAGPAIIRSKYPLAIGKWHTAKLSRSKKEGVMTIDDQPPVNGSASGKFQGLDLIEPLHVGGVPDFGIIHKLSGFSRGFVGCISRLIIGTAIYELPRDAKESHGVTTCETCITNPCENGGVCQEARTATGVMCVCPPGFSGEKCDNVGDSCYPGLCGPGRCLNKPSGFDCYCPFGRSGLRCEKEINIYEPAFRDDAYVAYPTPTALKKLKFAMRFKPRDLQDGLLMYCAQSDSGQGDFVSLSLRDKKVEFRFDTGSGPAVLESAQEVVVDDWTKVVIERNMREGKLMVNDDEEVKGRSPGHTRGLNLRTPLYIGSVDKQRVTISPFVHVHSGFDGCVSHIELSDVPVDLVNAVMDSANVEDCGGQKPCEREPCLNGGTCKETGPEPDNYHCTCQDGFTGKSCEEEEDLCTVISPCVNGGTCVGTGTSYKCRCPLGYGGTNCEQNVEFSDSVSFHGDGFLEFKRELLPHTSNTVNELITMSFETSEPEGLLVWHGQKPETDGKSKDFLALAIVDGYLEFSYELGSGPANIRSPIKVDDGRRHSVVLKRMGKTGSMELDSKFTEYAESQGILQMLNTEGNLYLGGVPNHRLMTAARYVDGLNGCIVDVEIQDSGVINLKEQAEGGVNALPCDSEEDYSGDMVAK